MNYIKHSSIILTNNKKKILYKKASSKSLNPVLYIKHNKQYVKYKKSNQKHVGGIAFYYNITAFSIQQFVNLYNQNASIREYTIVFTDINNIEHTYDITHIFDHCEDYMHALNLLNQYDNAFFNSIQSRIAFTLVDMANKHSVICNDFDVDVIKIEIKS